MTGQKNFICRFGTSITLIIDIIGFAMGFTTIIVTVIVEVFRSANVNDKTRTVAVHNDVSDTKYPGVYIAM